MIKKPIMTDKHTHIIKWKKDLEEYSNSPTFCALPWMHIATRPNGDVRVCNTANASGAGFDDDKSAGLVKQDGIAMNLREHTIEEVFNSYYMRKTRLEMLSGAVPESCKKCFIEESKGIKSKRLWETEVWSKEIDLKSIVLSTDEDGSLPVYIPYFDLRPGNMCNLKCVMCSPHDSSSWIKDWKLQYPKYTDIKLKIDQEWNSKFDYTWYKKGSFLESMKNQAENIKELYFAGGEPLMIPEHFSILRFMIKSGHAKDCRVRYNTNGTVITEELIEAWSHFKEVKVNFSIDAFGAKNDFIRYPSRWEDIETNLRRFDNETTDNVVVNIACAVQALNVMYLDELVDWKVKSNFKKINLEPYGAGLIGLHLVYFPSYLNIKVLPEEIKNEVSLRITKFIDKMKGNNYFNSSMYGKQRWEGIINFMNSEDWSHKLPSLKNYLQVTCEIRKQKFSSFFPELSNLYD
jgi:MoaA/NifB/PqqE/SkfB family radical SAM enzyme